MLARETWDQLSPPVGLTENILTKWGSDGSLTMPWRYFRFSVL